MVETDLKVHWPNQKKKHMKIQQQEASLSPKTLGSGMYPQQTNKGQCFPFRHLRIHLQKINKFSAQQT